MNRRIIYLFILVVCAVTANAQTSQDVSRYSSNKSKKFEQMAYVNWNVNFPTGSLSDFVSETSYSGGTVGYRKMLKSGNISVGLDLSWHSLSEYAPRKTYELTNGAITTDLYKYVYNLPFGVTSHYYFNGGKHVIPYAGLCIGTNYSQQEIYYNTYVSSDDNWGFYVRPEIGAVIRFDEYAHWGILVGAQYNYATNQQSSIKLDNISTVTAQLGIAWDW